MPPSHSLLIGVLYLQQLQLVVFIWNCAHYPINLTDTLSLRYDFVSVLHAITRLQHK